MKSKDAKRIRGFVHENDENKGASHEHDEMSNSCVTTSWNCSVGGTAGIGTTIRADGLVPRVPCDRQRRTREAQSAREAA